MSKNPKKSNLFHLISMVLILLSQIGMMGAVDHLLLSYYLLDSLEPLLIRRVITLAQPLREIEYHAYIYFAKLLSLGYLA